MSAAIYPDPNIIKGECFRLMRLTCDVELGWTIARKEKLTPVKMPLKDCMAFSGVFRVDVDVALASGREEPLLAATLHIGGQLSIVIIDGYHRMYKWHKRGLIDADVIVLNEEQSKKITL